MKVSMMKFLRLVTVFLIISSFSSVLSYPSRPLNERSTELAWQAWLLVDDQNQNKQNDPENLMRRKVIAKSVFIAPTFSPEKLPPCAEGYMSDSMGRCVRWVQLDHAANLDFLLQKLTGQFGNIGGDSDDKEPENLPTPGPIQFNIPFTEDSEEDVANSDENSDFAIIVSQTNNARPNKRDEDKTRKDPNFVVAPTNGSFDPAKLNIKNEEKNSEDTETTTATITTTETETATEPTTEQVFSTTSNSGDEGDTPTTIYINPDTTTQIDVETTVEADDQQQQALFFKVPLNTKLQPAENGTIDTPANADAIVIGSRINFDEESINNDEPIAQDSTNRDSVSSKVIFKDSALDDGRVSDAGDLVTSENVRRMAQVVRFPEEPSGHSRHTTQDLPKRSPGETFHQTGGQFKRPQRQNQKPNKLAELLEDLRHTANVFENNDSPRGSVVVGQTGLGLDPETENHHRLHGHRVRLHPNAEYGSTSNGDTDQRQIFNRRNRDKNFWRLTPTWRESSPQKTLVLRFSNTSNFARGNFYRHNLQNAEPVYRQLPLEDLSYIFGHKRKRINHR